MLRRLPLYAVLATARRPNACQGNAQAPTQQMPSPSNNVSPWTRDGWDSRAEWPRSEGCGGVARGAGPDVNRVPGIDDLVIEPGVVASASATCCPATSELKASRRRLRLRLGLVSDGWRRPGVSFELEANRWRLGLGLLARQMEHSCSRRWTASNSRRAKACLKPPECISWRVVARNLAISCQSFWRASGMGTSRAA